jgi:GT2 family glycosyltransferase
MEDTLKLVDISVCIVTYQARNWLRACLESLNKNTYLRELEIIVVDNGSKDGVGELLASDYPDVIFFRNEANTGFTRPMNQALQAGSGKYLLQLNPDTLLLPGSLDRLFDFMENHLDVGICTPKVINPDGSLQKQCRRGDPRPLAVIGYFSGLSRLFPKNKILGGYLLDYLDEDTTTPVDNVSGSCMFIRREVIERIGYLDEIFFAYQEDADFCYRARQAGWKIYYVAETQIVHYGGQGGSRVEPFRSTIEWHRSYWRYYNKHLARDYFFLLNWLYYLAMLVKLSIALVQNVFRTRLDNESIGEQRWKPG